MELKVSPAKAASAPTSAGLILNGIESLTIHVVNQKVVLLKLILNGIESRVCQ